MAGNTYYYVGQSGQRRGDQPRLERRQRHGRQQRAPAEVDLAGHVQPDGHHGRRHHFLGRLGRPGQRPAAKPRVGTSQTWSSVNFNIAPTGANNVIQATGQTITLPSGSYSAIELLATGVNGNQAQSDVHGELHRRHLDRPLRQSLSDWYTPQGLRGRVGRGGDGYRNTSSGGRDSGTFDVYGYSFARRQRQDGRQHHAAQQPERRRVGDQHGGHRRGSDQSGGHGRIEHRQAELSWTAATGTITGYNIYRGTTAGGESTTPINSTPLRPPPPATPIPPPWPGNTYYYVVKAINGPAVSAASNEAGVTMPTSGSTIQVDLAGQYNLTGITANGASFSGGLDGKGNALSETKSAPA